MKDIKKEQEEERKKAIEFIELQIDNFKNGVYKDSEELQKSVKEDLIKNLANLPEPERRWEN
ncbi:unnamed protein product [marine sediment metagenome]|uniref:Uncharacterized protein n=1 Tax=marine sediment metagenome TaxID=412755 RepID=X1TNU9_9ZZZZ